MGTQVFDVAALKKFGDGAPRREAIWSDDSSKISLLGLKPGQEVVTHTHHGSHVWVVIEGEGQLQLPGGKTETIRPGQIVVVPSLENHGIRNASDADLVIASFTARGD